MSTAQTEIFLEDVPEDVREECRQRVTSEVLARRSEGWSLRVECRRDYPVQRMKSGDGHWSAQSWMCNHEGATTFYWWLQYDQIAQGYGRVQQDFPPKEPEPGPSLWERLFDDDPL